VACLRLFESTHKHGVTENVGNHPNSYFTSSIQYQKDVEKKEKKQAVAAPAAPKAAPVVVEK